MKQRERDSVVSVQITRKGLTVDIWVENEDIEFRKRIAERLNDLVQPSNSTFHHDNFVYVRPSPQGVEKDEVHIYMFLKDEKVSELENEDLGGATRLMNFNVGELMKDSVEAALFNNSNEKDVDNAMKYLVSKGLPWPDCSSLFRAYLWLWIVIIVAVVLIMVGSAVLTWYCWKRGKSVELKASGGISTLPTSTDGLSGHDNPAMVIVVEENLTKKKQAPKPPTTTPDMSTFGKSTDSDVTSYDTAVTPFTSDIAPTTHTLGEDTRANDQLAACNMELQDTRL